MARKAKKPLAQVVALYTALVIAGAMAVYAVFQYFASPGHTVLRLLLEHTWHVVVLGILIYAVLSAVLFKTVVQPIRSLYTKLYAIATGDFRPAAVESDILEIEEIAEGINMMLTKIDKSIPEVSLSELSSSAQDLRALTMQSQGLDEAAKEKLLEIAIKIERVVASLTTASLASEKKRTE